MIGTVSCNELIRAGSSPAHSRLSMCEAKLDAPAETDLPKSGGR
jgi:hypothetical protein